MCTVYIEVSDPWSCERRDSTRYAQSQSVSNRGQGELGNGSAITLRLKKGLHLKFFFPKKFNVISKFQASTLRENFNRSVKCQGNFSSSRSTREFRYCAEGRREIERKREGEMQGLSRCFIHSPLSCPQAISLLCV